jgi:catalase
MTLNRNPENYFTQIEEAAFDVSNFVPGIDASPDKMLLARIFSYADAHRYRVGTNYAELPVNAPHSVVNSYSKEGAMRHGFNLPTVPVYAPNSVGGPAADPARSADVTGWRSDGELIRAAATLHSEDSDFGQAGALVREVMTVAERERLASNIAGHASLVTAPGLLERVIEYWRQVDGALAKRVAELVAIAKHG